MNWWRSTSSRMSSSPPARSSTAAPPPPCSPTCAASPADMEPCAIFISARLTSSAPSANVVAEKYAAARRGGPLLDPDPVALRRQHRWAAPLSLHGPHASREPPVPRRPPFAAVVASLDRAREFHLPPGAAESRDERLRARLAGRGLRVRSQSGRRCRRRGAESPSPGRASRTNADYSNRVVLFVGVDWERKGGPILVDAFRKVREKIPDARLVIAGCSPQVRDLPNVEILGRVPRTEVSRLMMSASVLALPSWREPQGINAIEALIHGIPVVASDVGALHRGDHRAWQDGIHRPGPGDVDGACVRIDRVALGNPELDAAALGWPRGRMPVRAIPRRRFPGRLAKPSAPRLEVFETSGL